MNTDKRVASEESKICTKVEVCPPCVPSHSDPIIKPGKAFATIEAPVHDVFNAKCDEAEIACKPTPDEPVETVETSLDSHNGSHSHEIGCTICVGVPVSCVCVVPHPGNHVEVEVLVGKTTLEGYYLPPCALLSIIV